MNLAKIVFVLVMLLLTVLDSGLPASGEIKTVYVVVPTHLDIGFTAPPDTVARSYKGCIDHAIQLCEKYPDYFYTIECAWQLREWMKRSTPGEIRNLAALVKSGRVEIGGAFASMHSGMMSGESVNRTFDLGLSLARELGGKITTAIQDDVPGYTWAYPQAMRQHGIRFFLTGINTSFGGKPELTYKDIPFYWEGPDGSRVLTWIANGYADASQWGIGIWENERDVFRKVPKQVSDLEKAGYRYDAFLVMASPGDNVDAAATEKVRRIIGEWNATGKSPAVRMATPRPFFQYMEEKYGERFPVYRGDWSGHWAPARLGAPRLTARMRFSQRMLPAAEALWSLLALGGAARFPAEDVAATWDDVLTISEHTASAGTGWPNLTTREEVIWENWQHAIHGLSASYGSRMLFEEGMEVLASSVSADGPFIVVFNPLSWKRSQHVEVNLPENVLQRGVTIRRVGDENEIEWDLLEDGRTIRFFAEGIPGLGYKLFHVSGGAPQKTPVSSEGERIATSHLTISVDRKTGYIESIHDNEHEREWVEKGRLLGAMHLTPHLHAMMGGSAQLAEAKAIRPAVVKGRTYTTLRVHRGEGPLVETAITVLDGSPMVKVRNTLDASKIPGDKGVVALLEFPFGLNSKSLKIAVDGPNHFRRWPDDFLPGTARIGQVVQSYAFLHDGTAGVAFIPVEAPILSLGRIGFHSLDKPTSARIYSYLFDRNLWGQNRDTGRTRYEEVEPALGTKVSFTYYLDFGADAQPCGDSAASHVRECIRRRALEATLPLSARFRSPWGKQEGKLGAAPAKSFLEIGEPRIELSSAVLVPWDGALLWRLRLQETSGCDAASPGAVSVGLPIHGAWLLDSPGGQRKPLAMDGASFSIPFAPFRTVTVLLAPGMETP
jgi:hypothetical protein